MSTNHCIRHFLKSYRVLILMFQKQSDRNIGELLHVACIDNFARKEIDMFV